MSSTTATASASSAISHRELMSIIFGVMLAMLLAALDQTIVATALPSIAQDIGGFDAISWVVTAYLLTATAATPVYGKLSDLFGRRQLLRVSIGIFLIGSTACALAPSMPALIAARALQGLGGGGLLSLSNTVIGDVISPRERGNYQAYFASIFASASVAGPLLGGFFAEHLTWTMIFWINLPIGAAAFFMSDRALRRLPVKGVSHRIDYPGLALLVSATVLLLLAVTWGGNRYPWLSVEIGGLVGSAALLGVLFVVRQMVAPEPILPLRLLGIPVIRVGAVISVVISMVHISATIYVPLYLELARGVTADQAGALLIPLMGGIVGGAYVTGQYMTRTGRYRYPPIIGVGISVAIFALMGVLLSALSVPMLGGCLLLLGLGLGASFPAVLVSVQNSAPSGDLGTATASIMFFRSLGGAVGVAAFGALVIGLLASQAGGVDAAHGDLTNLLSNGPLPVAVQEHVGNAFRAFFIGAALVLAVAVALFTLLKEVPLRTVAARAQDIGH